MKAMKSTTTTYKYNRNYRVDIVTHRDMYEAFLYHKDNGYKMGMFGCPKRQHTYDEFVRMIETNVPDYIPLYKEDLETLETAFSNKYYERG